jgi:hypothetical protein
LYGLAASTLIAVVLPVHLFRGEIERSPRGGISVGRVRNDIAALVGLALIVTRSYPFHQIPGLLFGNTAAHGRETMWISTRGCALATY